jgi:hypothetical protein
MGIFDFMGVKGYCFIRICYRMLQQFALCNPNKQKPLSGKNASYKSSSPLRELFVMVVL